MFSPHTVEILGDNGGSMLTKRFDPLSLPWLRSACYYLQRSVVNPTLRAGVIGALRHRIGRASTDLDCEGLTTLRSDGIVNLGRLLDDAQCDDIVTYLADKPIHERQQHGMHAYAADHGKMAFGIHLPEDVLDCPHIVELVSSQPIVRLAEAYLGCRPTLSCLGVQWSFPSATPGVAQQFHRDSEDWKYLRFLVYLTDVDDLSGPHVYVKGTHRDKLPLRLQAYRDDDVARLYGQRVVRVTGRRGTGLVADTCGIHKGELPASQPRLVLNCMFSLLPTALSSYQPMVSRHSPGLVNYTNRLFLR